VPVPVYEVVRPHVGVGVDEVVEVNKSVHVEVVVQVNVGWDVDVNVDVHSVLGVEDCVRSSVAVVVPVGVT